MSATENFHTVLWRNDRFHMAEYCSLKEAEYGSIFEGVVLTEVDRKPVRIAYHVACDRNGITTAVDVDVSGGLGDHRIQLAVDELRTWRWNGKELPDCQGGFDVDLGFSPSTNSLPIRRLQLNIGESHALTTTWVRFPEFDIVPFPQRYTRLEDNRYLFESLLSDFQAELVVDSTGMVLKYGAYWEAIAACCFE